MTVERDGAGQRVFGVGRLRVSELGLAEQKEQGGVAGGFVNLDLEEAHRVRRTIAGEVERHETFKSG